MKVKSDATMEVEKKQSKGGFFHLFDWNGKSRKKLFLNTAEISGESKKGKPVENQLKSPPFMVGDDYNGASSNTCSAVFSSASSVTSDEGCGSRAPGVVARLMGLESLPTPNISELSSTTYSGSCSLRVSHYERSIPNLWNEYPPMDYTVSNKLDRSSSDPIEPRFHTVKNRPIERFQTEILPPKSARPIPITHHKLLSPVKSPGFIPTKNAAYIMEAAAKIIDVSPQTTSKTKGSSFGSSSVALKIRDLKEKIEAAHKVSRPQRFEEPSSSAAKSLKEGKSHNKSDYASTLRTSRDSEKGSCNSSRNKGKSVPLAQRARANGRRKEESFSGSNGSSANPEQGNDAKGKQFSRSRADMRKNVEDGTSANRTNNVLRQNNQKQNCISGRDYSTSNASTRDRQGRKVRSLNGTVGLNRTINKVTVTSESQSRNTGSSKELPMSRRKNLPRKKQTANDDLLSEKTVSENSSINGVERSIKCNVTTDGKSNQDAEKMKTSMDVVSFTFTSPIKRCMPDIPSTIEVVEPSCSVDSDPSDDNVTPFSKSSGFSSLGLNKIGGEALSVILAKQLHELTYRVESSSCNIIFEETSCSPTSSQQNSVLPSSTVTTTSTGHHKRLPVDLVKDISLSFDDFDCSSIDNPELDWRRKWQLSEEIEDRNASSSSSETGIELGLPWPSPLSTLELATKNECFADGSRDYTRGIMCFTPDDEVLSSSPIKSSHTAGEIDEKLLTTKSDSTDFKESTNSELDYVKMVLKDSDLKFIEYALGQTDNNMILNAFDRLQHWNGTERHGEDCEKLELKLLLDCVSESLKLRYDQVFIGSCKGYAKWGTLIQNKECLAEELYKDILGWRNMADILVVDDLVGKNMNAKHERWLDFDMEAFEEALEVENTVLTCLVDELVFDLLL
ncbi:uncharacterized protein LOC120128800 [Hibiscus syriacus]|uniref:uncharacterized protein LOC120128800 n=1 Tax=Hibiscus syriacus TaxID=106335 RepID=UPI0019215607|nr:uncharacterized protein LOC120128800 [Hibiscus syriacus]